MASGQTSNFGLNQWEPGDQVLREEFNADNRALEEALLALAARPRVITGTYTGDGGISQLIPLEASPRAVLSMRSNGYVAQQYQTVYFGGLALEGKPVKGGNNMVLAIEESGFRVYEAEREDIHANTLDNTYHYLALL